MKICMSIIVAVLLCTCSGCGQMNTRISPPWTYWEHGLWPVIGVLIACGLVLLAIITAIAFVMTEVEPNAPPNDDQFGYQGIIALLLVAGLLLQVLPHTTNGVQFVPLFPWHYSGWIAGIASVVCWLCILAAFITAGYERTADLKGGAFTLLVALGLNALLSFATPVGVSLPDQPPAQIEPGQNQIAQWERRKDERAEALAKLLSDKEALVARIKGLGAKTKQELMAHKIGQTLMEEFEQLARQIATVRREVDAIETMTERAKSRMRSLEREALLRGTKVTDEEYRKLCGTDHVLEEELRRRAGEKTSGSETQLDKLLDEVLAREN